MELTAGEAARIDLNGDGKEEEVLYPENAVNTTRAAVRVDDREISFDIDDNIEEGYIGLMDLNAEDGKYELAVYADGPSGDPVTVFLRYDGKKLYEIGRVYGIFDRKGAEDFSACTFGDGILYGSKRMDFLETRWVSAEWILEEATDRIVFCERDYYEFGDNPYTAWQEEFPYHLKDSVLLYAENSREADCLLIKGEHNRITRFMGTDGKNWMKAEVLTDDGLKWGWLYAGDGEIEVEKDVFVIADEVIENLCHVD